MSASRTNAIDPLRNRQPLLAAGFLALAWLGGLTWLAFTSANPVTVNREQIGRSTLVIQGKVTDLDQGTVEVEKILSGRPPGASISVRFLKSTGARNGDSYLFPLEQTTGDRWIVVPTRLPGGQPLIYPAGSEAITQTEVILHEQTAEPVPQPRPSALPG